MFFIFKYIYINGGGVQFLIIRVESPKGIGDQFVVSRNTRGNDFD